ncbi:MAG: YraN family protein [Clostridia bacterium]|nr:YraN family protein [Clostridia bacterium]
MYSGNVRSALVGKAGEDFVAQYLKSKGYIIIKRNWRDSRYGEIDIVAENRECIAFVEVKTRQKDSLVSGLEAVDFGKQQRTRNASQTFMRRLRTNLPPRLDVAEVTVIDEKDGKFQFEINYIKNAF